MGMMGDKLANIMAANCQGPRLTAGLHQLQQNAQYLEVLLLKLLNILRIKRAWCVSFMRF
jgi:hypothetical protein